MKTNLYGRSSWPPCSSFLSTPLLSVIFFYSYFPSYDQVQIRTCKSAHRFICVSAQACLKMCSKSYYHKSQQYNVYPKSSPGVRRRADLIDPTHSNATSHKLRWNLFKVRRILKCADIVELSLIYVFMRTTIIPHELCIHNNS